jgi:hypothetical protein
VKIIITEGQLKKIIVEENKSSRQKPKNQTYSTVEDRLLVKLGSKYTMKIPKGTKFTAHQTGDKKLTTPTYTASVDRIKDGKNKPSTVYYCNGKNANKFWNSVANAWFYDNTKVLSGYLNKNLCGKSFGDQSNWENKKIDIKGQRTPEQIANFLRSSDTLDDDEPSIERAFSEIKTWERYKLVKKYLGQDPYKYVSKFIDVREKHGPLQSVTTSFNILSKGATSDINNELNSTKGCSVVLTAARPGGPKQYLGNVNYMKFFKGEVGTPGADPLLYKSGNMTYAKVPADFGWNINVKTYPYPIYYSQACLNSARNTSGYKELKKQDNNQKYTQTDSETTQVKNQLPGKQLTFKNPLSLNEDANNKDQYKTMQDFNQALSKQKELIPQYCKTPLKRDAGAGAGFKDIGFGKQSEDKGYTMKPGEYHRVRMISMYNLCKDYGGLWVYGAGSSKYTCGCRDNSNLALTTAMKTDTGKFNAGTEIQKQQGSTNWSNVEARSVLWGVGALAAAFIPVVGPFVAAGIGLGGAADLWTSNKKKEAAITAFFALLPMVGKIPGVGSIGKSLAQELKVAVIEGGALTEQQLNTLMKIIKYDSQVSDAMIPAIESEGMGKLQSHIVKTAVKETEKKIIDLAGVPTYGNLKKAALKTTVASPIASTVT